MNDVKAIMTFLGMACAIGIADVVIPTKTEQQHGEKVREGTFTLYWKAVQDVKSGDNARGCNHRNTTTEKWLVTNTGVVMTFVLDNGTTFQRENWTNGVPRRWKLESAWKEAK